MGMTVVRRIALAGVQPFAPVALAEGVFYYTPSAASNNLRKVDFGTGADTVVTAAMPLEVTQLRPACIVGGYYCTVRTGPPRLVFVNLSTGAVTTHALGAYNLAGSPIPVDGGKVALGVVNGADPRIAECVPPAAPTFGAAPLAYISGNVARSAYAQAGTLWVPVLTTGNPSAIYLMRQPGAVYSDFRIPKFDGADLINRPGEFNRVDLPQWFAGSTAAPGHVVGFGYNGTTGEMLAIQADRNLVTGSIQHLGVAGTAGGWCWDAIDSAQEFSRVYWNMCVVGRSPFRLYGSPFPSALVQNYFLDLDVGPSANSLTAIFCFPPFLYAFKGSGVTYGGQMVKVHDPELERHSGGRRGGELFSIMPEVGRYLP